MFTDEQTMDKGYNTYLDYVLAMQEKFIIL